MSASKFARPSLSLALSTLLGVTSAVSLSAQSVTTTPVGAVTLEALANSDSYFSIPLVRPSFFEGVISSIEGNNLTLTGANFTANELQYSAGVQSNTYYIQIASGAAAGQFSTVLSNTTTTVVAEYEQDILDALQVGDRVVIRPYWTLGTVFPASSAGSSFVASTSNFPNGRRTEVLLPNTTSTGINKSASATYFFNGHWQKVGSVGANRNDSIIPPDTFIVIRGNNYSTSTSIVITGAVQHVPHTTPLFQAADQPNDNPAALAIPVETSLEQLDLIGANNAFVPSTSNFPSGRGDELLVFDNSQATYNKSASATYFYNSFWRKVGDIGVNQNSTTLPAGSAIIIRKKQGTNDQTFDWTKVPVVISN